MNCPKCGNRGMRKGFKGTLQMYKCTNEDCDQNYYSESTNVRAQESEGGSKKIEGNSLYVVYTSMHAPTQEELLKKYEVNLDEWELVSFEIKDSMGYRKDRKVNWDVSDGHASGSVRDSGKMLVVTLYHTHAVFKRKVKEIEAKNNIQELIEYAKTFAPVYPKIYYAKKDNPVMLEISLPDLHFGRLSWGEESGEDYDIKIAYDAANRVIDELLYRAKSFDVEKILFPIGQDWYNVNSKDNTTVNGTVQQEDTRGKKTYKKGRELAQSLIDMCATIAPVDVLVITGNHDEEKLFYMGDALECIYANCPNVNIDNRAVSRKYYLYGKILLGFTHGCDIKKERVPMLMPLEAKEMWAKSEIREWHMGHIHSKLDTRIEADEGSGLLLRRLRSIVPADAWTFNHGFVGAVRAAESFIWHPENGLIGQFTAIP